MPSLLDGKRLNKPGRGLSHSHDGLTRQDEGGVLWLTLDRPQVSNALDRPLFTALSTALCEADDNNNIRAVVLTGAGDRVFSAGRDIKRRPPREESPEGRTDEAAACLAAIVDFKKPLIAAVNGVAIGFGCMLALLADQIIASERGTFSLPEIDLGLPTLRGMTIVAHVGGLALARDLALTGRRMTASEAQQRGLVAAVVGPQDLHRAAQIAAEALAGKPASVYAINKAWLKRGLHEEFAEAVAQSKLARAMLASPRKSSP